MTAAELLSEYRRMRDAGTGKARLANAYQRYFRQAVAEGNPPDSLQRLTGTEPERFFPLLIAGLDGHNYWDGPTTFRLDAGGVRNPRWWWYEHLHGKQPKGALNPVCGQRHCITPNHQQFVDWSALRRRYSDEQLLGSVQVVAMRLGYTPTRIEYDAMRGRGPTSAIVSQRFGSWATALRAAGCRPRVTQQHRWSVDQCIEGVHLVTKLHGQPPRNNDYRAYAAQLRDHHLPSATATILLYLGPTWNDVLKKAGLRS